MSVFKTRGIILKKIYSLKTSEDLFIIFSLDYGKIKAFKKIPKKEKNLDIGYIIDFEIETKVNLDINKIKSIKILNQFDYTNKDFTTINLYMEIINIVLKNTPDGLAIKSIFEIIEYINKSKDIDYIKLVLAKLKIFSILGVLNLEHKDINVSKILHFIDKNNISKIFLLTGIDKKTIKNLENIK